MRIAAPPSRNPQGPPAANPTFSVIIAAYQVADCIADAISSALEQTRPPEEVIVCDDGSTDDLEQALRPFRDRIVVIRKPNGGEASAKNAAARAAHADFISILDADDAYLPSRLEALGKLASQRPDLDILTTDAFLEADGQLVRRVYTSGWTFADTDQRHAILERNFVFGNAAVRRSALLSAGGFDEGIRRTTDWECWIRMVLGGSAIGAVLEPLARYRLRRSSLSADRGGMLDGGIQTLSKTLQDPRLTADDQAIVLASIARMRREVIPIRLNEALLGERSEARRAASRIVTARSTPPRTRIKALAAFVAPRAAAALTRRRHRDAGWVGAGGTTVERA